MYCISKRGDTPEEAVRESYDGIKINWISLHRRQYIHSMTLSSLCLLDKLMVCKHVYALSMMPVSHLIVAE